MNFNTIQATVLQKNLATFICGPCGAGSYSKNMPIPSTNALPAQEYWAVPIKDPYFQGFRYEIADSAPTIDSIACFKLTDLLNSDYYMVVGTIAAYSQACAACCDASPAPTLLTTLGPIAPCETLCTSDGTNFIAMFAVETISSGKYVATVVVDGVLVKQQTYATGSTTIAALIIYLNANASSAGTWSNIAGTNTIKLVTTSAKTVCFLACIKTS